MTDTINILCTNATVHGRYSDIKRFILFWLYMYCDSYSIWINEGISLVHMLHNNIFGGVFIYKTTLCNDRHIEWYKNVKYCFFNIIYMNFKKKSSQSNFYVDTIFPYKYTASYESKSFLYCPKRRILERVGHYICYSEFPKKISKNWI